MRVSSKVYDLGDLTSCSISVLPEGAIRIPAQYTIGKSCLYVPVEGVAGGHVAEAGGACAQVFHPRALHSNLGDLPPGDWITWPERPIIVTAQYARARQASYEGVECMVGRHVAKPEGAHCRGRRTNGCCYRSYRAGCTGWCGGRGSHDWCGCGGRGECRKRARRGRGVCRYARNRELSIRGYSNISRSEVLLSKAPLSAVDGDHYQQGSAQHHSADRFGHLHRGQ